MRRRRKFFFLLAITVKKLRRPLNRVCKCNVQVLRAWHRRSTTLILRSSVFFFFFLVFSQKLRGRVTRNIEKKSTWPYGSTCTQHASCTCPTLSGETTTSFGSFSKQGFRDKRKINLNQLAIHDRLAAAQRRQSRGTPQPLPAPFFLCVLAHFFFVQSGGWPRPNSNAWRRYLLYGRKSPDIP